MPAVILVQHQEQQRDIQRQQDTQQDRRAAERNQHLRQQGYAAFYRHLIGQDAVFGRAHRLFQAVYIGRGQGRAIFIDADQEQLHHRSRAFQARLFGGLGRHFGQIGRFIQRGMQQRLTVGVTLSVAPGRHLLLFGRGNLGAVERIGDGKQLQRLALQLIPRKASKHRVHASGLIGLGSAAPVILEQLNRAGGQGILLRLGQFCGKRLNGFSIQAVHLAGQLMNIMISVFLVKAGFLIFPAAPQSACNQRRAKQKQNQQRNLAARFGRVFASSLKLCLHLQHSFTLFSFVISENLGEVAARTTSPIWHIAI